jgi:multiple sugar transport system ATP-binding protein
MNLIRGSLIPANGGLAAKFGINQLTVGQRVLSSRPALKSFVGKRVIVGIRPEDLEDVEFAGSAAEGTRLSAAVDIREDMGSEVFIHFGVGGEAVESEDVRAAVGEEAAEVSRSAAKDQGTAWVARLDRDTKAAEQGRVELSVDTDRLHFFDPESGDAIYAT